MFVGCKSKHWLFCFCVALPVIITHPNSNGSIIVAEGNNVVLICEATGEGTLNYQWIKVSGSLPEGVLGNKDSHLIIRNIAVNDSGQYYCKVDNGGTSVSSMKAQVIVKSKLYTCITICIS